MPAERASDFPKDDDIYPYLESLPIISPDEPLLSPLEALAVMDSLRMARPGLGQALKRQIQATRDEQLGNGLADYRNPDGTYTIPEATLESALTRAAIAAGALYTLAIGRRLHDIGALEELFDQSAEQTNNPVATELPPTGDYDAA